MKVYFTKNRYIYTGILWVFVIAIGYILYKNIWFLATYSQHEGYEYGVFGSPTPFTHSLFYSLFWATGFAGITLLILSIKTGWILTQIIAISGVLFLGLTILISIFTPSDYFSLMYISLFIVGVGLLFLLNSKSFIQHLGIVRKNKSYRMIILGILITAVSAIGVFNILSI